MQVDAVARVRLDVGFKRPRRRERFPHRARDRRRGGVCCGRSRPTTGVVWRWHAVAATEDEVLIYFGWLVGALGANNKVDFAGPFWGFRRGNKERKNSLPTRTWTGPLKSGAVEGEAPRVRISPVVKGCLVDSEYGRMAGSKKPGSRKVLSLLVALAQVRYPLGRCPNLLG